MLYGIAIMAKVYATPWVTGSVNQAFRNIKMAVCTRLGPRKLKTKLVLTKAEVVIKVKDLHKQTIIKCK